MRSEYVSERGAYADPSPIAGIRNHQKAEEDHTRIHTHLLTLALFKLTLTALCHTFRLAKDPSDIQPLASHSIAIQSKEREPRDI